MGPIEAFIGLTLCDFFFRCQRHWAPHFRNVGNPVNNKNISLCFPSFLIPDIGCCLSTPPFLPRRQSRPMDALYRAPLNLSHAPLVERHPCPSSSLHCHQTHLPNASFLWHLHARTRKGYNRIGAHVSKAWGRLPDNTRKSSSLIFLCSASFQRCDFGNWVGFVSSVLTFDAIAFRNWAFFVSSVRAFDGVGLVYVYLD